VSTGVIDPLTGIPSQATTEVTTRMIVPDGQTIFVGGLIKNRIDESKSGIPIISRVPGVGKLFSNSKLTTTNTETIVLITPTVVRSPEATIESDTVDKIRKIETEQDEEIEALDKEMDGFFGARSRQ